MINYNILINELRFFYIFILKFNIYIFFLKYIYFIFGKIVFKY